MSRIQARELAFKVIFSMQFDAERLDEKAVNNLNYIIMEDDTLKVNEDAINSLIQESELSQDSDVTFLYSLINSYINNFNTIKEILNKCIEGYKLSRVYKCDMAVLELAISEMLLKEYDYKIVINEAVELAKKYSEEKSYKFVHGVLSKVVGVLYNE